MGDLWDAPNQQVVRPDASPPWVEGEGGSGGGEAPPAAEPETEGVDLDDLTKDEMLARARELGVSPANAAMTKDELRAGIEARLAEG